MFHNFGLYVEIHKNELIQLQYDIISNEIFSYKYHFKPY